MKQETGRLKEILHVLNQHNVTHGINPEKLCSILEDLGPTYVKLGRSCQCVRIYCQRSIVMS